MDEDEITEIDLPWLVEVDKEHCEEVVKAKNYKDPAFCHVTHRNHASVTKYNALAIKSIEADLTENCTCANKCTEQLDVSMVLKWRKKVHTLVQGSEQKQRILELYQETLFENGYSKTTHIIEGRRICRYVWYKIVLKICHSTYKRIRQEIKYGKTYFPKAARAGSDKGQIALGFMKWKISVIGDHSPENDRIMLPVGLTINDIYQEYRHLHNQHELLEKSRFYQIWHDNFPHVTPLQNCRFSKCNVCVLSRQLLQQQNIDPNIQFKIVKDREEHLQRQQKEREAYYTRRAEAAANPKEKLSIIIDGMDQSKLSLPHFKGWNAPKMCDPTSLLQTHINGVLVHGLKTYNFIDLHQWPHDSNLTINCMLQTLQLVAKDNSLPPKLFIQLDNCGRENKNRFFIGMVAYLIKCGFVQEVLMSFLMTGHTHEDIDSRFSKISVSLKRNSANTLPRLMTIVEDSLKDGMVVEVVGQVYNVRDWIAPFLNDIHNQSLPHVYRFFEDQPGHVTVKYKNWSTDENWLPLSTEPQLEIFKQNEEGMQLIPDGQPSLISPDIARKQDLAAIKKNIDKLKQFLNSNEYNWWSVFLNNPLSVQPEIKPWFLQGMNKSSTSTTVAPESTGVVESPLSLVMERERALPSVYTGKKRKTPTETTGSTQKKKTGCVEGAMVMYKSDGEVGIGSVIDIGSQSYCVRKYRGPLNGTWEAVKTPDSQFIEVNILKSSVLDDGIFVLSINKKLPSNIHKLLKTHLA